MHRPKLVLGGPMKPDLWTNNNGGWSEDQDIHTQLCKHGVKERMIVIWALTDRNCQISCSRTTGVQIHEDVFHWVIEMILGNAQYNISGRIHGGYGVALYNWKRGIMGVVRILNGIPRI